MKTIIFTLPGDFHAHAVRRALAERGHCVDIIYPLDICDGACWGVDIHKKVMTVSDGERINKISLPEIDLVWNRRIPTVFPMTSKGDDLQRASSEIDLEILVTGILVSLEGGARCINPLSSSLGAHRKINQLVCAERHGIRTPDSIITNNIDEVIEFIMEHRSVVYKPQMAFPWKISDKKIRVPATTLIEEISFFDDVDMHGSPSIFQKYIKKKAEVRAVFMGDRVVSWVCRPTRDHVGEVDWRYVGRRDVEFSVWDMPESLKGKCLLLMRDLGISFGCFDFAIDDSGEYFFLEVNPSGQFLYGDNLGIGLNVLGEFVGFLEGGSPCSIKLGDFLDSNDYEDMKMKEKLAHKSSLLDYRYARASVEIAV